MEHHYKNMKGFTLAEVLITLGIIGVVAALTMPVLIGNYQKEVTVTSLKKMYSTLTQAAQMYQAQNGITYEEFDTSLDGKSFMAKYFNPYLHVIKECNNFLECYEDYPLAIDRKSNYKSINYIAVLSDGSYLGVFAIPSGELFFFDINGAKGPNYSGRDIFSFYLINKSTIGENEGCAPALEKLESGLYPGGYGNCYVPFTKYSREELLGTSVHRACNRNATAISVSSPYDACAAVIMMDGWKIAKDYPW